MGLISFLLISKPLYSSSCHLPLVMTNGSQQEPAGWQQEDRGFQPLLDIQDTCDAHSPWRRSSKLCTGVR